jgi:hypothetical protein
MNVDLEAGGALVTAGLAAKVIDGQSASGEAHEARVCANCKAPLVGPYCHACGQTAHVHRSIWHMLEEGLHGVLHFDSKIWRTLPLLCARPGLLTRRYIDGQRVRYVSPLAFFLFTIFLMFFVLSFSAGNKSATQSTPEEQKSARDEIVAELESAKGEVAKHSALVAAAADEDARQEAAQDLQEAQIEQRAAEVQLSIFDKAQAAAADPKTTTLVTAEELKALTGLQFDKGTSKAGDVVKDLTRNPELMIYKFKNTAYKFSFMLIPISLPFLWLMFFWKREVTMYDHMVFSMYSLSFMSLLFVAVVLLGLTELTSRVVPYLIWLPPLHMFLQLKEAYKLSFGSALWRTIALLISAGTGFVLFLIMVIAITAM